MHSVARSSAILTVAILFCGCGSSGPSPAEGGRLTGPWDIVLLDAATGKPTGPTIRQYNQIIAVALSGDEQAVVTSCRKALPGPQAKQQAKSDDKVDPTRIAILRVWNTKSGKILAEQDGTHGGTRITSACLGNNRRPLWINLVLNAVSTQDGKRGTALSPLWQSSDTS